MQQLPGRRQRRPIKPGELAELERVHPDRIRDSQSE